MMEFKPTDAIEGMMAAQAVGLHSASMECLQRAMLPDDSGEAADQLRRQGANMGRAFTDVLAGLDRKRGKSVRQVVRVERVMVAPGAQAIIGNVQAGAPAYRKWVMTQEPKKKPTRPVPDWHTALTLARSCPRCRARTRAGTPYQSPAMSNGRCRMHGSASTGSRTAAGQARISKARTVHGLYSAEMVELRRHFAAQRAAARQWNIR